ncbi:MAG TPA: FKBP-type peptidyl-prolyl cis-trans isomerase [Chitinophagaceae bacterium]|nr:FKBP-type peptidyl-prolyl cis-trans isomerase [Chitinophagaceae bacterium]
MKRIIAVFLLMFTLADSYAQTKKAVRKTTVKKPAVEKTAALSSLDSFSYAMGVQTAQYFKIDGVEKVNTEMIKKAYDDVYNNKPLLMATEQCNAIIQTRLEQMMMDKIRIEKEAGSKFLEENKKRPGVVTLPDGMQYEVITKGTGPLPTATDTIKANYIGTTLDGKEFDNSYKRGSPLVIPVSGVIRGWTEALQLMPVGSKWKLYIPSDLAYGDRGAGTAIPGGAALIFEIELLGIVHNQ